MTHSLHLASALLADGWQRDVTVDIGDDGRIVRVRPGSPATTAARITGHAAPGLGNVHSHAHQRAMAGLAERAGPGADSFWTWREAMYAFALRMGPAALAAVMAQLAVECLKSGFTAIGEFHYLHHQPDGRPYDDPAEMSLACLAGAEAAGIAITLLPTLYAHGGFGGQPPTAGQRRFVHESDGFARLLRRVGGEIAALNAAFPGRRFRVRVIDLSPGFRPEQRAMPMVATMRGDAAPKAADASGWLAGSEKAILAARVVLAAAVD